MERNLRSVSLCSNLSGVAYRIWGTLQLFKVLENRMSTSSLKSDGSLLANCGPRLVERLGITIPRPSPMRWTLSMHWEMSVIQAAFSCLVGATRWSEVSWPDLTASICILKSRLWYSAFPAPLPLLRSLRLLALLSEEHSEDSEQRRGQP